MADPSADDLGLLLELQHTDHRVRRLRRQLGDLPEQRQLDEVVAAIDELGREHDDVRLDLDRVASRQRQLEREIEVLAERRDAERTRLYDGSVANAREMQAVEAEVASTERRIAEQEDQLLEVLEEVENLEERAEALTIKRDAAGERAEELTGARDAAAKGILAELGELDALRDRQADGLPGELLERYTAAAERGGGTGVGELDDTSCTACRIELSLADVSELLAGPPLTTCPQCRRLLVVPA